MNAESNKPDLLLQMMQQPEQYTADEWEEILTDDECRELYTLMSKTQSAIDAKRTDEKLTDDMIEAEWQTLSAQHQSRSYIFNTELRKFAALFIGILMFSGIALAAIHFVIQRSEPQEERITNTVTRAETTLTTQHPTLPQDSMTIPAKQYENVPLEQILAELSDYYHYKVVYRDEAVRQLRLFYQWRPEYSLDKVIEMLNNFESLRLQFVGDTLYVSSNAISQP